MSNLFYDKEEQDSLLIPVEDEQYTVVTGTNEESVMTIDNSQQQDSILVPEATQSVILMETGATTTTPKPSVPVGDYVTLDTDQTITGNKDFAGKLTFHGVTVATLDDIDLSNLVDLTSQQTISGLKIFKDQIGIINSSDGDINLIKHINNNFLITENNGTNILNIDEQLQAMYLYNKKIATEEYVNDKAMAGGSGTVINVGGVEVSTLNFISDPQTQIDNISENLPKNVSDLTNDAGFITKSVDNLDNYYNKDYIDNNYYDKTEVDQRIPTALSHLTNDMCFIDSSVSDLLNYYTKTETYDVVEIDGLLNSKVDKVTGKGLSTNDYTTDEKNKLNNIEDGAEKNKVNSVNSKGGDIVLTASDVGALPNTTKYGSSLSLAIDYSTYKITAQLKDQNGTSLGTSQEIDLPLESVVVSGSYDATNKKVILTLENGNTISFSVVDLVSGLVADTRKIAGVDLKNDITTTELSNALNLSQYENKVTSVNGQTGDVSLTIPTQASINAKYTKPAGGIPASDLAENYVTEAELNAKDYATVSSVNAKYTKPSTGIPAIDLAEDYVTEAELNAKGYATTNYVSSAVSTKANQSDLNTTNNNVSANATAIETKLDKVINSTKSQVYGVNASGEQSMYDISTNATSNGLVIRSGGQIDVATTPMENSNATSKQYVDTEIDEINQHFTDEIERVEGLIASGGGTAITIGSNTTPEATLNFTSDPQTQINTLSSNDTTQMGHIIELAGLVGGLRIDKADIVANATANNLASLNASGNLVDSGISKDNVATKDEIPDVSNKADKVGGATANNLASLDASGNLKDSGIGTDNGNVVLGVGKRLKTPAGGLIGAEENTNTTLVGNASNPVRLNGTQYRPDYYTSVDNALRSLALLQDVNSLSMCPDSNTYMYKSIANIKTADTLVFTAPSNGYATIRGNYSKTSAYHIVDGAWSFYQWVSGSSSPFFPLRKGANVYVSYIDGTVTWADIYFVGSLQL